ncbi:hypothetical protein EB001_11105 [bacterium]|nr:hypothetical protein [bacterium]
MSIEQKIAQILAESKTADDQVEEIVEETIEEENVVTKNAAAGDQAVLRTATNSVPNGGETPNEANAKNNAEDEKEAEVASKKPNVVTAKAEAGDQAPIRSAKDVIPAHAAGAAVNFKEDVDALVNGEDLSEEFKAKAATIFEAAIVTRVKEEVTRLQEEFDAKLEEAVAQNQEGLVEKVDGYLSYVAEQWMENNEIALESGMKSDILEGFVSGLKGLFEEHYIDIPEEKFDVLGSMEETLADLQAKLDEQVAVNVELSKVINEATRESIIADGAEGLAETDKEKFFGLAEELAFEDSESFAKKVQTIRENYFTNKASTIVESVVTDTPVENLTEEVKKPVDPSISKYMSVLNNIK